MRVIAVVGSASGSGKTKLASVILRAIPGLGAVKISPRVGPTRVEWGPGAPGKDTARYAESGAAAIARIVAPRGLVAEAWEGMRGALAGLPGVVVEGAGALSLPVERFTIFVAAAQTEDERPERDELIASSADCIVFVRQGHHAAGREHPTVSRRRTGIPVIEVAMDEENWAEAALLDAVRCFLFGRAPTEQERALRPKVS